LLWLTVVVALAVGWIVERSRLAKQRDECEQKALDSEGNFISLVEIVRDWGITVEKIPGGITADLTRLKTPPVAEPKSN
jgi:hypothetical protein